MGIYGALSTAVTGLRAQSFALENISGNISNSQTTGFKRIDTDFVDLIPDAPSKLQSSGSVLAQSRSTATLQGDVKSVSNATYMAINGSGFFVVEPSIGQADGQATFAGTSYYTRRGDFDVDKSGYLVNGAGYYLKGLPIDASTQNVSGSVPQVLQISNSFLPAAKTTRINYQLNLPQLPKTAAYMASKAANSELMTPQDFQNVPADTSAVMQGATAVTAAASSGFAAAGNTFAVTVGSGSTQTFTFTSSGGTSGNNIDLSVSTTIDDILTAINGGISGASFAISGGRLVGTAAGTTNNLVIADNTTGMGFTSGTAAPTVSSTAQAAARVNTVSADDSDTFIDQSVAGGAITAYAANGAPAALQMRWAKIGNDAIGGTERWALYYQSNSAATGANTMWTRVPQDYEFDNNGALTPPVNSITLTGLSIDGTAVGDVQLYHGPGGLTQFNDPNGASEVTALSQNGYAAGQYLSVAINDAGRVVVSYSNGKQVEVAQVITADFNAANQLKRLDGGVFAATSDSGDPILNSDGAVMGASLESSNTDISEEFTKLIVTQQAYAAGTRIVSTADQMLQEALNMVR